MTALVRNLSIEQGATFKLGFTLYQPGPSADTPVADLVPYDLTGCSARMEIRQRVGGTMLVRATSESLGVGVGGGRIVLDGGRIVVTLTDLDTDLLTVRKAVYDIEVQWPVQAGELRPFVSRVLSGEVAVSANVTTTPEG